MYKEKGLADRGLSPTSEHSLTTLSGTCAVQTIVYVHGICRLDDGADRHAEAGVVFRRAPTSSPASDVLKPKPTPPAEPCIEPAAPGSSDGVQVQGKSAADDTWRPAASVSLSIETLEADPLVAPAFTKSTHVGERVAKKCLSFGYTKEPPAKKMRTSRLSCEASRFPSRGARFDRDGRPCQTIVTPHRREPASRQVRSPIRDPRSLTPPKRASTKAGVEGPEDQGMLRIALKGTVNNSAEEGDEAGSREHQAVLYTPKWGWIAREVVQRVRARRP
ncbi:hypothetical protein PHLGIDRAFT_495690 [Phlebiopsis gigantea 11061_1 CR5-6]|uniref:Uncharacterized protein n=1 Tax=Phlebiopsis gigantea (strain 11061_1 CR5-6) TaxID=745531 RepID=A0A0C3S604_PHLG1|nr:hypothetical protein PHLGIDRAFT_495690 [Phlebiopsis gigantea 11061_1 CR5-6]